MTPSGPACSTASGSPPHGGADFDDETWALDMAGVTRAFIFEREFETVTVRFMSPASGRFFQVTTRDSGNGCAFGHNGQKLGQAARGIG